MERTRKRTRRRRGEPVASTRFAGRARKRPNGEIRERELREREARVRGTISPRLREPHLGNGQAGISEREETMERETGQERIPGGMKEGRIYYGTPERYYRQPMMKRLKSAHFERYAEEGNRFVHEVANRLGLFDHHRALRITRAVLHALRDRLPPDDAVQFGQGLPMMIKAVYFDQYDISDTPVDIRKEWEFINYIREKAPLTAAVDFPADWDVVLCFRAVFSVLEDTLDYGQTRQIKRMLPHEIVNMLNLEAPVPVNR